MKRFLLSSLMLLTLGRTAFAYVNDRFVQVPTMDPELIQIDDPIFVNNNFFSVDTTLFQSGLQAPIFYETSSTLYVTNTGTLVSIPGFDFENFPASVGQPRMLANFENIANGFGGGVIAATNIFGGFNIFQNAGTFNNTFNWAFTGFATVKVRATNVVNSGLITADSTGLIDIAGKEMNFDSARVEMTGANGINVLDWGGGGFGTNSSGWTPAFSLQPGFAISPLFTNNSGVTIEQEALFNSTPYFENLNPQPGADGIVVWRIIFLQDSSPTNVSASVFFGGFGFGDGAFHIQWTGAYRDSFTGGTATNYFLLSNEPVDRRGAFFFLFPAVPQDFSFAQSTTPLIVGNPATPGYVGTPFPFGCTNDFTYINVQPTALSVATNQIVDGNPTNLPGRIHLKSQNSLNLANAHISGENYLELNAPVNYLGNTNSKILAPWADLNLGVTSGSLILSNLLSPELPGWTTADIAPNAVFGSFTPNGGIQAFSGSYFFVDGNGVTNDVRVLLVNSALQPTLPALQKDVKLHAANNLVIADKMNIVHTFSSDTTTLTVSTNANSGYSLKGELNLLNQNILLSASLPNLQYFTNWGGLTTRNEADFAGNLPTQFSPRSGATPIQAFVNHGMLTNQGIFVFANYFENSGSMMEFPGNIDINVGPATITNSTLIASNGAITIAASCLLISNSVIHSDRTLTLAAPSSLSDGYAFGNQFGHFTNATLPNVVTNGNGWTVGGGVQITVKPPTADLLGTTITNISVSNLVSITEWAGADRGATPSGFADNLALGRMIFDSDGNPSGFKLRNVPGNNNALYVDAIEFRNGATNTDGSGSFTAFQFDPGMKVYYAQATMNGFSIAEKLNGKNGGGFLWVSNYAGVYSSTNLPYPDGKTYIFNAALVGSPNLDSDGDGTVNVNDPTPIPAGLTFDISVTGPQPCIGGGGGAGGGGGGGGGGGTTGNSHQAPGTLGFPAHSSDSTSVSFALAQGSYSGLFYETNGVNPASSGFFTAKVTGRGGFSAKLQLGAKTYSFSSAFNSSGNCTAFATSKGLAPLTLVLHLVNNDQIVGTVSSGNNWSAQLLAVNQAAAAGAGKHSLVLSTDSENSTTPSGDSFGTMTLGKKGDIQWSGVLPDGVKVSQKSALSKDGIWPLYSSLYGGSGSLIGWLQLTNGNADIGGSAVWIVPANQNALYPNGLTNELNATGSSVTSSSVSHTTVILNGPHLTSPLTNSVTISGKTGQSADKSLTLSVDVKNGLFNGSVVDSNSGQTLSFQGALLEKSGVGGGFFLNANKDQGGKVYLAPAN